ncbi:hypothetical protein LINPERPRIM_LOCUS19659 [Linum perenne]
MQLLRSR